MVLKIKSLLLTVLMLYFKSNIKFFCLISDQRVFEDLLAECSFFVHFPEVSWKGDFKIRHVFCCFFFSTKNTDILLISP